MNTINISSFDNLDELLNRLLTNIAFNSFPEFAHQPIKLNKTTDAFGFYPARDLQYFMEAAHYIKSEEIASGRGIMKLSFLECGAGLGLITQLATLLFPRAVGIEYQPKIIKTATELWRNKTFLIQDDLLSFTEYKKYNVLYWYTPLRDKSRFEFHERVVTQTKVGTYFILYRDGLDRYDGTFTNVHKLKDFGPYTVYRKVRASKK